MSSFIVTATIDLQIVFAENEFIKTRKELNSSKYDNRKIY